MAGFLVSVVPSILPAAWTRGGRTRSLCIAPALGGAVDFRPDLTTARVYFRLELTRPATAILPRSPRLATIVYLPIESFLNEILGQLCVEINRLVRSAGK